MRRTVLAILRDAQISQGTLGVVVVDDPTIAELHGQFLADPTPTDVLSFLLEQSEDGIEGEVIVSAETALAVADKYGNSPEDELLLYVVHGVLHLVGYDDTTPKKRAVMRRQEKKYMKLESA